jgi:F-type H+-transporting ATPase subunit b
MAFSLEEAPCGPTTSVGGSTGFFPVTQTCSLANLNSNVVHSGNKEEMPVIMPDYTLFIQIANFLLLLVLLNAILYRPIRRILKSRKEEMDTFQNKIQDFEGKFSSYTKRIQEGTAEARKEGLKERESLKKNGQEEEKQMLREASSKASGKIGDARKEMDEKLKGVRLSLEKEMALFSKELAEKVLGRSL